MKKIFLGLIAAGMLYACNPAKSSNNTTAAAGNGTIDTANAPVLKFERETHDFGKIKAGDIVKFDFKFTNTGKSPLIITHAQASCGCTTPTYPKEPVAPGKQGVVHVEFNSSGKMGLQDKQITVTANSIPAESRVHLIGEVLLPNNSK